MLLRILRPQASPHNKDLCGQNVFRSKVEALLWVQIPPVNTIPEVRPQ